MNNEQKELLLKDLCARLPYGVKASIYSYWNEEYMDDDIIGVDIEEDDFLCSTVPGVRCEIILVKPYLYPLSSMTEEQKKEVSKRYNLHTSYGLCIEITNHSKGYWDDDNSCHLQDYLWLIDWFNKNHFDYRGLIPLGLAIDCTNLNIY